MNKARPDQGLTLEDGRELGYAEYGDSAGWPVFYFHGFPGSRLEWRLIDPDDRASELGCRILAPDRPGIGLSTPKAGRRLLDWPSDVEALADALAIRHFSVLGVSGGGPFAAACAYQLPERVSATSIVSGMGTPDGPGAREGLSWSIPGKPRLLRLVILKILAMGLRRDPHGFLARGKASMPEVDGVLLDDPAFVDRLSASMAEAFRSGVAGVDHDAAIYRRAWGFELREIAGRVHLWHGGRDRNVPISVGRHVAGAIVNCSATFLEKEGHFSLLPRVLDDVLESVRTDAAAPSTRRRSRRESPGYG